MRRLCLATGCGVQVASGYCAKHRPKDTAPERVGKAVYNSKRWKILRRRQLSEQPLCQRCGAIATDVHHRHGVVADPWSLAGLESLCHPCHSAETRQAQITGTGWPE